ncbi:MAG TPA: hypothetical protein VLN59_04740, partial [Burkholderiales bacterium]|nr:hypothetical protein [Burkholderiales bacterium]
CEKQTSVAVPVGVNSTQACYQRAMSLARTSRYACIIGSYANVHREHRFIVDRVLIVYPGVQFRSFDIDVAELRC